MSEVAMFTRVYLLPIILTSALAACGATAVSSISPLGIEAASTCGPLPEPVPSLEGHQMAALDLWLVDHVQRYRPLDLSTFRRRYLLEPTRLRDQIRGCHEVMTQAPR